MTTVQSRADQDFWDRYWANVSLPAEAKRTPGAVHANSILDVLDAYLPADPTLHAAELGGAPGEYLAYIHKQKGYRITAVDYSAVGCAAARENFRLLGIDGSVVEADIFSDDLAPAQFDIVFSLGLIEHFDDRVAIVDRHVRLLRPGGFLVLGVPNLRGLHGWFLRRLAPRLYGTHYVEAMDLRRWTAFETKHHLRVLFKGYIGGFEPTIFTRRESKGWSSIPYFAAARALNFLVHRVIGGIRRFNGPRISGYAMAVYRMPTDAPALE